MIDDVNCLPNASSKRLIHNLIKNTKHVSELKKILNILEKFDHCPLCNFWRLDKFCDFCDNLQERKKNILCIVPNQLSVISIEETNVYNGVYFVLKSEISCQNAEVSFKKLEINSIINFIENHNFKEIIFATNFNLGGEWTARFIKQKLEKKWKNIKYMRLSCGVPVGAEVTFVDPVSLKRSFLNRNVFTEHTIF